MKKKELKAKIKELELDNVRLCARICALQQQVCDALHVDFTDTPITADLNQQGFFPKDEIINQSGMSKINESESGNHLNPDGQ